MTDSLTTKYASLIDQYRDINVHHEWWDSVYEYWTEHLKELGVDVAEINFTGFWSQGDGACFTGRIHPARVTLFMEKHGLIEDFPGHWHVAQATGDLYIDIVKTGNFYSHSRTVGASISYPEWVMFDDEFRQEIYDVMYEKRSQEEHVFEQQILEILRGYMDDIYRDLEEEYEYLTNDEAVLEYLKSNDMLESENEVA